MKDRGNEDKPTMFGTLTTRILVVEREPLIQAERGMTVGQMIDRHLETIQQWHGDSQPPMDWKPPVVHSITLELPQED